MTSDCDQLKNSPKMYITPMPSPGKQTFVCKGGRINTFLLNETYKDIIMTLHLTDPLFITISWENLKVV